MMDDPGAAFAGRREELRRRKALPDGLRRQDAAQATLNKFRDTEFNWREGRHCVRLAHFHMRQMGHKPPTLPRVRSALSARKALAERKCASVSAMLDELLPRIAPAEMMLGDLATVEGEAGLDAVFVCVGPRRLFGWREDEPVAVVLEVSFADMTGAWRV